MTESCVNETTQEQLTNKTATEGLTVIIIKKAEAGKKKRGLEISLSVRSRVDLTPSGSRTVAPTTTALIPLSSPSVTSQFQIQAKRSRIWTPTVEDERAPRVRSEHPQRLTVRRALPVKNGKNPSVAGGLKETLGLSQQEAPFPLHCGLTHGNPRVSRHRRAG
ncbi:hypothetical protein M9H77_04348 [Catharanthus roseus]|uniref:Uncharacterized protein n=1 Tax=Catharanthus roseus TaxID=4058 RepID=A0ACC0CDV7_CATRO|nr:hypothetical protein M9H77_04348 [Catharanthus roseus]